LEVKAELALIRCRPLVSASNKEAIMQPVLHPVSRFCDIYGIGRTKTYELINTGALKTVKVGRKTLITESSARQAMLGEAA
jgi:hypothetical protein